MAQIAKEALDGILGNMFLTSPPLCTLEELGAKMCVSCLAESSRALGTEWFHPGDSVCILACSEVSEKGWWTLKSGGQLESFLLPSSLRSSYIHWKILRLYLQITSGFWSLLSTLIQSTDQNLGALATARGSPSPPFQPCLTQQPETAGPSSALSLTRLPVKVPG